MSTQAEPTRWKDLPTSGGSPEARAGGLMRAATAATMPDDLALARLKTRIQAVRPRRRRRLAWALAALALFAGGAAFALALSRPRTTAPALETTSGAADLDMPARAERPARQVPRTVAAPPAHPNQTREVDLLRRAPAWLLAELRGEKLDAEGFTVGNRRGFLSSGNQRYAMEGLVAGAALGRRDLVDEAWRGIDATFRFQHDDGHFLDPPLSVSYWLAHLSHGLMVLGESDLGVDYRHRMNDLLPHIERAAMWLAAPPQRKRLESDLRRAPSRMLYLANAFGMSGELLGHDGLRAVGREYLDRALREQRPDGAFDMDPPLDAIYQGEILWKLSWYAVRFPEPRLDEALRRGGAWQLERVRADGVVFMAEAGLPLQRLRADAWNVFATTWALVYQGLLFDPIALDRAIAVRARREALGIVRR